MATTNKKWIEINLTPIGGFSKCGRIETVSLEVIRYHGTARSDKDKETNELPLEVYESMKQNQTGIALNLENLNGIAHGKNGMGSYWYK